MEVQVSALPGMRDCFAALPLDMIDALQGRLRTQMFKAFLELRLPNANGNQGPWFLAWAGAASSSSCIEVSKLLADSMGLPCGSVFHVRALSDVSHAESIELEPATEDDWEILEPNAGFVEDHVLSQVGVLCSGQKFPIWVEGGNVLMLHVIVTKPKSVVQLVPGSELVVAPKLRNVSSLDPKLASSKDFASVKAVLRVQELQLPLMQPWDNICCSVAPTTAIFISEQTAKALSFENGQVVVISALIDSSLQKEDLGKDVTRNPKVKSVSSNQATTVVLSMVFCDLVAKGHAMLASSLCHFIGTPNHSRVEVKAYSRSSGQPKVYGVIVPFKFRSLEPLADSSERLQPKPVLQMAASEKMPSEWQQHKLFLENIFRSTQQQERKEHCVSYDFDEGAEYLLKVWAAAQVKAISKYSQKQCSFVPIMAETVLQFSIGQEFKVTNLVSDNEHIGRSFKGNSETLIFLLSLHVEKSSNERNGSSGEELSNSLPLPFKGCFFLDVRDLQATDADSINSMAFVDLKIEKFGHPRYGPSSIKTIGLDDRRGPSLSSLSWLKGPASSALQRLQVCLSPEIRAKWCKTGLPSPGFVLLHGPPACGKTKLALAIANELEKNPSILCHSVVVRCAELAGEQAQAVRAAIQEAVIEALKYAPSLVVLDDLDSAIPANASPDSSEPSTSSIVVSEYLSDLLDTFRVKRRHCYDRSVSFLALAKEVSSLPASLCSSGRFDLHIALLAPATTQRAAILSQELENRGLICPENVVSEIASRCDGYDAADLEVLIDRTVHAAAPRLLILYSGKKSQRTKEISKQDPQRRGFELEKKDFEQALDGFSPVCMRDLARPSNKEGPLTWKDVGGLNDTCRALQEMLEFPVKHSKIFSKAPLRLRTGVLLYGPPGCGKTHVVGIAAAACSLRLFSVKGPEILNKYKGASEQAVRDLFAKARAAAPCILFFDEFDAIAPQRGLDNTGVTDPVVSQLLAELDGVEALNGVFVFAATSRPDLLDAALVRPGRLDRLLLCDFPTANERLEILQVLSRKLPLAKDVRLDVISSLTDAFSGADLQAILSDAHLEAVHSLLSNAPIKKGSPLSQPNRPIITMATLTSVLRKARPSVSDQERHNLHSIYDSFISSRSSMIAKVRDVKGKRATLA